MCIFQGDPGAAAGLATALTALEAAEPAVTEAEKAQQAFEKGRPDLDSIAR